MGLFSRWFGPRDRPPVRPLRDQLFAAHDDAELERLCRHHRVVIAQQFIGWRTVPELICDKPAQMNHYVHRLIRIAEMFDRQLGDRSLMQLLSGTPWDNPVARWDEQLGAARQLKFKLRYREAADRLADLLIDFRGLGGSAVDSYLPFTLGEMGECLFQAGLAERAIPPTEQALALVKKTEEPDGIQAYLGNLYEIHRYLDQPIPAAARADQLADLVALRGQADEAERYRRQACLVRAGEPRNRVVAEIDGRRYEMDEVLGGVEGRVRFHFERNKVPLRPSQVLTESGQGEVAAGRFDEALALFREAARADPCDPQPHHDAANSLMHLGRVAEAIDEYAATEDLAPAWFHCRHERWLAEQVALGRCDQALFLLIRVAENGDLPPVRLLDLADRGLAQAPDLPALHHIRGKSLALMNQPVEAARAFRRGLACADEPDIRSRLLVDSASLLRPGDERRIKLEEAIALEGNLVAAATARILLTFQT